MGESRENAEASSSFFTRWMGAGGAAMGERNGSNGSGRAVPGGIRTAATPITPPRAHTSTPGEGSGGSGSGGGDGSGGSGGRSGGRSDTLSSSLAGSDSPMSRSSGGVKVSAYRLSQFEKALSADNIDLKDLRKLAWSGVPWKHRTEVWQLLLGYMPTNKERRRAALARKRKEYTDSVVSYFDIPESERSAEEAELLRQIIVDLHRTCPMMPIFHQPAVQKLMERILYIWSLRHPASGYVQGMNDLLTPIFLVCLHPYSTDAEDVVRCDVEQINEKVLSDVEADAYWCLTKLLDDIQDHYTPSQPGLQRMVLKLEDLVRRIDHDLDEHFKAEEVSYLQFSFRWMNCILLREMPMRAIIRLWDTYLSEEGNGFETFHTYVCAAVLQTFQETLMRSNFQDMLIFLQDMPTMEWHETDVEVVLSQAFILSSLYEHAPSHLK